VLYSDPTGHWIDQGNNNWKAEGGDTLWGLAKKLTGNGANWANIGFARDPRTLRVDEVVNVDGMVGSVTPPDPTPVSSPPPDQPTGGRESIEQLANEVIAGNWGNGQDRRDALAAAGYDYNSVQDRVNAILGSGSSSGGPSSGGSSSTIVTETINDDYGRGNEGYDTTLNEDHNIQISLSIVLGSIIPGNLDPSQFIDMLPGQIMRQAVANDPTLRIGNNGRPYPYGGYKVFYGSSNNEAIRIDPSDNVTGYYHVHLFDRQGNSLDAYGNIVKNTSPAAHIQCKDPYAPIQVVPEAPDVVDPGGVPDLPYISPEEEWFFSDFFFE